MLSWKNKHGRGEPKSLQRADGNAHYTAAGLIDGAGDIRISAMADGLRSPYKKKPTEVNDFWRRLAIAPAFSVAPAFLAGKATLRRQACSSSRARRGRRREAAGSHPSRDLAPRLAFLRAGLAHAWHRSVRLDGVRQLAVQFASRIRHPFPSRYGKRLGHEERAGAAISSRRFFSASRTRMLIVAVYT
jgi:hypothetical protein